MDKNLEDACKALDAKILKHLEAKYAPYLKPNKQVLDGLKFFEDEYTKQRIKGLLVLDEQHTPPVVITNL